MLSQALILCGGLGTRLGELTVATPKVMLPVAGRPFLDCLIQEIARYGVTHIVLLAGRFGEQIVHAYDGRSMFGANIEVVVEPAPLGTAGALRFAADVLAPEFLLLNGDSFINADLIRFARQWYAANAAQPSLSAQMLLQTVPDVGRFGSVMLQNNHVVAFTEKNPELVGATGAINAGVYILKKHILELIPPGKAVSLEADILPAMVSAGRIVAEFTSPDSYFIDIGVPETFSRAQEELPLARTRPAVFFDRDGTLNVDVGYTHSPADLVWMPDAREAIAYANSAELLVFVITNQAGVARGYYDEAAVLEFHSAMQASLFEIGAHIDAIEWCPHHIDGTVENYRKDCRRRKPNSGMIDDLLNAWPVDKAHSLMIGNTDVDMDTAAAAGIASVMYSGGSLLELLKQSMQTFGKRHWD